MTQTNTESLDHIDAQNKHTAEPTSPSKSPTLTQKHKHKHKHIYTNTHTQLHKHTVTEINTVTLDHTDAQNYFTTPSIFITDSWPEALSQILFSFQKQKHSSADKHFAAVHWLCSKAFLQASTFGPFSNPIEKHFQITFTRCSEEGIVWDVVVLEVSWLLVRGGGTRVWVGSTSTVAAAAPVPLLLPFLTKPLHPLPLVSLADGFCRQDYLNCMQKAIRYSDTHVEFRDLLFTDYLHRCS